MCEICRQYICPNGCPNAEDNHAETCYICEKWIYPGEEFARIESEYAVCCECLNDMTVSELYYILGIELEKAEEGERENG